MIYLLLFSIFFSDAHEELGNLECQDKDSHLKITKLDKGYKVSTNKPSAEFQFEHFSVKDEIKKNQVFDVYSTKTKDFDLKVYRPETKGAVKNPIAVFNKKSFNNCKVLK